LVSTHGLTKENKANSEFERSTCQLPSSGDAAIAASTPVEKACCLHGFEDAEMEQGSACVCQRTRRAAAPESASGFVCLAVLQVHCLRWGLALEAFLYQQSPPCRCSSLL
jgi:hypothetical protein